MYISIKAETGEFGSRKSKGWKRTQSKRHLLKRLKEKKNIID